MRNRLNRFSALAIVLALAASVILAQSEPRSAELPNSSKVNDLLSHCAQAKNSIIEKPAKLGVKIIDSLRGRVKTGADSKAKLVNRQVQDVTIEHLASLRRPRLIFLRFARVQPVEFITYRVQGTLVAYRLQLDGDYHLILRGESVQTMIAEIPDPKSVGPSSPFRNEIAQARNDFANNFHPTRQWQTSNKPIPVTGIGFWDFPHFQRGAARNAIEIHPVLAIKVEQAARSLKGVDKFLVIILTHSAKKRDRTRGTSENIFHRTDMSPAVNYSIGALLLSRR